jgi:hypothetical protein
MTPASYGTAMERKSFANGYVFGAPVRDLGWFASLLMGLASGMAAFFAATFCGIFTILMLNAFGHKADYTISYRLVGLPVGLVAMVVSLGYLGTFWAKRVFRKG